MTMGERSMGLSILLIIVIVAVPALVELPLQVLKTKVNIILDVLRNPSENKAAKEKVIWPIINEIFDNAEISKRTLANYWRAFTLEQQKEFIPCFENSWVMSTWTK
jgi:ABC-type transporter MlaC component